MPVSGNQTSHERASGNPERHRWRRRQAAGKPSRRTAPPRAAAFWLVAGALCLLFFAAGTPSPLYGIYRAQLRFSTTTLTAVFAIYALVLLITLLGYGRRGVPRDRHTGNRADRRRRAARSHRRRHVHRHRPRRMAARGHSCDRQQNPGRAVVAGRSRLPHPERDLAQAAGAPRGRPAPRRRALSRRARHSTARRRPLAPADLGQAGQRLLIEAADELSPRPANRQPSR
jgi:hypothetical protein